ncbi:MAG: hypothetical protein ABS92_00115 [Thiobacillus sp. SCN 63-374]|nr:MAG: hypothetical protein ABS92_00115 [Thiobacillus sp. SCN 63-374]
MNVTISPDRLCPLANFSHVRKAEEFIRYGSLALEMSRYSGIKVSRCILELGDGFAEALARGGDGIGRNRVRHSWGLTWR